MKRKIALASVIPLFTLAVSIDGDVRAHHADQQTAILQKESQLQTQLGQEHQNVNVLASDAKMFDIYRVGQNMHLENRSGGAVRHIYITWHQLGSGKPMVQTVPDLPKCYEYVLPAQGKATIQPDEVPDVYWTDLTGFPWTRNNGLLVNPVSSHSTEVETPDQPTGATVAHPTPQPLKNC